MGYDARDFARPPRGFGFLVPRKERRRLVACTWVGTKFSYRVPEDKVVARCFLGGRDDAAVLEESDDAVAAMVTDELREIAQVTAPARFRRIFRWPRSMAQYTVGHPARLREMARAPPPSPVCTSRGTPTRGSESPTASAWAARRRRRFWRAEGVTSRFWRAPAAPFAGR